jgi:hypothetical protein
VVHPPGLGAIRGEGHRDHGSALAN